MTETRTVSVFDVSGGCPVGAGASQALFKRTPSRFGSSKTVQSSFFGPFASSDVPGAAGPEPSLLLAATAAASASSPSLAGLAAAHLSPFD
jgi:hypothetical protein